MLSLPGIAFVIVSCAWVNHSLRIPTEDSEEVSSVKEYDENLVLENMIDLALHDFMQPLEPGPHRLWREEPQLSKTLHEMQCDAQKLKHRVFMMGSFHKTGTNLFRQAARFFNSVVNISHCANRGCVANKNKCDDPEFHHNKWWHWLDGKNTVFLCDTETSTIKRLEFRSNDNLRGVMVIRDPLAMLVSGYVYHKNAIHDCGACAGKCQQFKEMSVLDGLRIQTECTKRSVASILDTYRMAQKNLNLKIIRFEDLMESSDSFDEEMKTIFAHLTGGCMAGEEEFVEIAANLDLRRNPNPPGRDLAGRHISPKDEVEEAMKLVLENELDKEFHNARSEMRYI